MIPDRASPQRGHPGWLNGLHAPLSLPFMAWQWSSFSQNLLEAKTLHTFSFFPPSPLI